VHTAPGYPEAQLTLHHNRNIISVHEAGHDSFSFVKTRLPRSEPVKRIS
jgi:hypothetical protein